MESIEEIAITYIYVRSKAQKKWKNSYMHYSNMWTF